MLITTQWITFWNKLCADAFQIQTSSEGKNKDNVHNTKLQTHGSDFAHWATSVRCSNEECLFGFLVLIVGHTQYFVAVNVIVCSSLFKLHLSYFNAHQAYVVQSQEEFAKALLLSLSPNVDANRD